MTELEALRGALGADYGMDDLQGNVSYADLRVILANAIAAQRAASGSSVAAEPPPAPSREDAAAAAGGSGGLLRAMEMIRDETIPQGMSPALFAKYALSAHLETIKEVVRDDAGTSGPALVAPPIAAKDDGGGRFIHRYSGEEINRGLSIDNYKHLREIQYVLAGDYDRLLAERDNLHAENESLRREVERLSVDLKMREKP